MKLSEIFSQLTTGELSQLGVGGAKGGAIAPADYHKILNHVNLGLADLFSRFTIRQGRLILALQPGKESYSLNSAYAVNARRSQELVRYIQDTPEEPFLDDVTKVERVLTDAGYEFSLNQQGNPESVITPSATVLRLPRLMLAGDVPDHLKTSKLEVYYRAAHPMIVKSLGPFDPARVEVALPRVYLQALLYFVASRAHNPSGMTNEFHTGNSYAAKYERECVRLVESNLQIDQGRANTRAERNGWV